MGIGMDMHNPSTTKIEHRALNALEEIIDNHLAMEHQFNGNDKEMSWDGYIWLYKTNNGKQTKENFDGRVPVQIKGHSDLKHKYVNEGRISYPVELADLKAYATEKGVLYFQIFIDKAQKEIFYASLYPSKIAYYLDTAAQKGNTKSISIPFFKLSKDANKLYSIAKQFDAEATKQGSAYTPLVQDRIKIDDFDNLTSVNLTVFNSANSYENLLHISTGDICLYGKTEGDKYFRPMEWSNRIKFSVGKDVFQPVSIGDEVFFEKYHCIADSDGGMLVILSPNLKLHFSERRFSFVIASTLQELCSDAIFLLKLYDANSFYIAEHRFDFTKPVMEEQFVRILRCIFQISETVERIGLKLDTPLSQLTTEQKGQLVDLANLQFGKYNDQLPDGISKYLWEFGDKYFPLLICKENDSIELTSLMSSEKQIVYLIIEENGREKQYRVPQFACYEKEILSNLYYYDYEIFRKQIDECDINELTAGALLGCVLNIINVYDLNNDTCFLDLAEYLLQRLAPYENAEITLLNKLQIKKRRGTFDDSDIKSIKQIDSQLIHIQFGKNVLMGNKDAAVQCFEQFPDAEKEAYKAYPIYNLFLAL